MKVAIIGIGHLGAALARGLLQLEGFELSLCDPHAEKLEPFRGRASLTHEPNVAAANADVVLLAVKPQGTPALAQAIARSPGALLVSCAAGVRTASLPPASARAMPNVGASTGVGTTAIFLGPGCDPQRDSARIRAVFEAVGTVLEVPDESWFHAVTAIAASGPAFIAYVIEALVDAGVASGIPANTALELAKGAIMAANANIRDGVLPAQLRAAVTSPNGTTAAGMGVLEGAGVKQAFADAVAAAVRRSEELSR